ncbi:hypothetical protein C8A05DRAFT_32902 [Staphylotrichum tortipilum]|uniref:Myb-like DNA-binding domain-containing protein n=1 Tax=Staphylotrichum tortipilum TaxID=2831512 RepID=A0AAN6MMY9_9PEZI|nr:hypothetical protein C8A05DRAFT_32902 [Staphylotrichum longicolle]
MAPKLSKAAAGATDADGRKQPTQSETYLFYAIIKHMKGKPEIDWTAVANDTGLKNAETAKVRYGQIKRKLGLDTWTPTKPRATAATAATPAEDGGAPATPATPTPKSSRSRKTAATPSTPGTGAGVKKRGASATKRGTAATPSTGRGRKAKSQALLNLQENPDAAPLAEEGEEEDDFDDASLDNEMLTSLASPAPTANGRGRGRLTKPDLGPVNNNNNNIDDNANEAHAADYALFPNPLPEMVMARKAVLVFFGGAWTLTPASEGAHARWLARLPANVQTVFYQQAHPNGGAEVGGGGFVPPHDGPASTTAAAGGGGDGETIGLGYLADNADANAAADGPAAAAGDASKKDGNGVALHPAYAEEMEMEQEARDREALFGGAAADEEEIGTV